MSEENVRVYRGDKITKVLARLNQSMINKTGKFVGLAQTKRYDYILNWDRFDEIYKIDNADLNNCKKKQKTELARLIKKYKVERQLLPDGKPFRAH